MVRFFVADYSIYFESGSKYYDHSLEISVVLKKLYITIYKSLKQ